MPERLAALNAAAGRLRADRRGVSTVVFAAVGVVLLAFVGLGVEGGLWYLEKRQGQNAADAAALSGAIAAYVGQTGTTAATTVATQNGYTNNVGGTTVAVATSTANDSTGTSRPAIQVTITRSVPRLFSSLMLGAGNTPISETAAAVIGAGSGPDCALALNGGITFSGSTSVTLNSCEMVSNNTSSTSINIQDTASKVSGGSLISAGGCSGCASDTNITYLTNQLPSKDPLAALQDTSQFTMPSASGNSCSKGYSVSSINKAGATNLSFTASSNPTYICGTGQGNGVNNTLSTPSGTTTFANGTYVFYNASLNVNSGTVSCSACTFIFTGDKASDIGTVTITANANVNLTAPTTNSYSSLLDGVLFYMDPSAVDANGNGNSPVNLTGNGTSVLNGAVYFPSVTVNYTGNFSGSNPANSCTEVISKTINMGGNSTLSVAGCTAIGAAVGQYMVVEMVK